MRIAIFHKEYFLREHHLSLFNSHDFFFIADKMLLGHSLNVAGFVFWVAFDLCSRFNIESK